MPLKSANLKIRKELAAGCHQDSRQDSGGAFDYAFSLSTKIRNYRPLEIGRARNAFGWFDH
jgi:hypothetical protein